MSYVHADAGFEFHADGCIGFHADARRLIRFFFDFEAMGVAHADDVFSR